MRRPTALSLAARAFAGALASVALVAARPAAAQFAGVPAPPPRPASPAAAAVAARPKSDSVSRLQRERDSLSTVQRLDIQAWVDSAAPALARRPTAVPADSARRRPAPARRPDEVSYGIPARSGPAPAGRVPAERSVASVADRRRRLYLRPWPCPATRLPAPPRSV